MNSQNEEIVDKTKETIKMPRRNEQMMVSKIWLNCLKRNPVCGIFFRKSIYIKREVKERVYAELAEFFDSSSAIVKAKINALRAHLGREMAKKSNTKSGQATDEKHVSKWMFYEQLKFLRQ